jgi:hypothetical protein
MLHEDGRSDVRSLVKSRRRKESKHSTAPFRTSTVADSTLSRRQMADCRRTVVEFVQRLEADTIVSSELKSVKRPIDDGSEKFGRRLAVVKPHGVRRQKPVIATVKWVSFGIQAPGGAAHTAEPT